MTGGTFTLFGKRKKCLGPGRGWARQDEDGSVHFLSENLRFEPKLYNNPDLQAALVNGGKLVSCCIVCKALPSAKHDDACTSEHKSSKNTSERASKPKPPPKLVAAKEYLLKKLGVITSTSGAKHSASALGVALPPSTPSTTTAPLLPVQPPPHPVAVPAAYIVPPSTCIVDVGTPSEQLQSAIGSFSKTAEVLPRFHRTPFPAPGKWAQRRFDPASWALGSREKYVWDPLEQYKTQCDAVEMLVYTCPNNGCHCFLQSNGWATTTLVEKGFSARGACVERKEYRCLACANAPIEGIIIPLLGPRAHASAAYGGARSVSICPDSLWLAHFQGHFEPDCVRGHHLRCI
jgi:hypothetical protein